MNILEINKRSNKLSNKNIHNINNKFNSDTIPFNLTIHNIDNE